ncbi:leucyl/phenylalanyl-tRNA--protein transferase [Bdellovibrio sp. qaytius]|nr:leucyl/phenylalanyl-tRNA--protein transferase [Bdellovibrio sp. qaytius]
MSALNDFPDPLTTEIIDGVIAVGGDLDAPNLKLSYSMGIFPWPHEGYPLLWFCPDERGILEFSELYINRSLDKWIRKYGPLIEVTVNKVFPQVIVECQQQLRGGQKGSWITPEIIEAYTQLSQQGNALSVECWLDGELISGIYGVKSKNYFSCESMFFKKPNASKFAFLKLVEHLETLGFTWMDLQMVTDVCESLGGKYISRAEFLERI